MQGKGAGEYHAVGEDKGEQEGEQVSPAMVCVSMESGQDFSEDKLELLKADMLS